MKKKLQDMERLCEKMQARFGAQDELVLQFKQELAALQEKRRKNLVAKNYGRRRVDTVEAAAPVH